MGTDSAARSRRRSTVTLALATALAIATSIGTPSTRAGTGAVFRIAGPDRYATSVAATATWSPGYWGLIVASGENFPDGLAAGVAAGGRPLPMLLVRRDSIPPVVAAELDRLDPATIFVAGGPASVSTTVESVLKAYATTGVVKRLGGADRYGTAVAISEEFGQMQGTMYVAAGMSFPDALAGAGAAGTAHAPLLLVPKDSLPDAVRQEILRLLTTKIVLLGGTGVVSAQVEAELSQLAPVTRIAGAERYQTAVNLSAATWPTATHHVFIASGTTFPDGLVGGAVAGERGSPLLLVPPTHLPANVAAEIERLGPDDVTIFGGTGVVSQAVEDALIDLLAN